MVGKKTKKCMKNEKWLESHLCQGTWGTPLKCLESLMYPSLFIVLGNSGHWPSEKYEICNSRSSRCLFSAIGEEILQYIVFSLLLVPSLSVVLVPWKRQRGNASLSLSVLLLVFSFTTQIEISLVGLVWSGVGR